LQRDAVARDGGLIAIVRQLIAQVDELALELPIRRQHFGIRIDDNVAFAPVDDNTVTRFGLAQDSRDAADGGNPAAAGNDGCVARLAAGLGNDSVDRLGTEHDYLAW